MTDHFFEAVNPLWYPACDGGLLQLAIVTFWPHIMPYESLSYYGTFTKYLAYNHHYLLASMFWVAMFLHVLEAGIALRTCKKLNIDSTNTRRWFIQTLLVGYVSLGKLKNHGTKKRQQ